MKTGSDKECEIIRVTFLVSHHDKCTVLLMTMLFSQEVKTEPSLAIVIGGFERQQGIDSPVASGSTHCSRLS